ncbi:hypothetical protein GWI33_020133 [Rhynchophorus ferrugineus]|uniref:Uncharacterized protein n=1 Tax=Rhynchophorus ferrugineus TaxID=354439 RepID=A0A834M0U1_RHYFE|nr:hypothetical protein GWI33_020133 [Rhynchophorus ferrugineus]
MNDVEAKREARRRRILENSENRLLKISGVEKRTCGYEIEGYKSPHLIIAEDDSNVNGGVIETPEIFNRSSSILNRSFESQTSAAVSQQRYLTKNQRISIIVAIATILNILILCFQDNIVLNKIFLPVLCFEAIDLFYHQNQIEINGVNIKTTSEIKSNQNGFQNFILP